jgi:hypothetical protein
MAQKDAPHTTSGIRRWFEEEVIRPMEDFEDPKQEWSGIDPPAHHDATPDASDDVSWRWYSARSRRSSSFLGNAKKTSAAPSPTATMPAM